MAQADVTDPDALQYCKAIVFETLRLYPPAIMTTTRTLEARENRSNPSRGRNNSPGNQKKDLDHGNKHKWVDDIAAATFSRFIFWSVETND